MRYLLVFFLTLLTSCTPVKDNRLDLDLEKGSGFYVIPLGPENLKENIEIYYYMPPQFNGETSVMIVIPGAGRNANDYRDSWIESANKYNLLVLSPSYPEKSYDFAAYHLGGIVDELELKNPKVERVDGRISKYRMNDEDIQFSFVKNKLEWIFDDFDLIFSSVKPIIGNKQTNYDLFGHSAGGQILHRFAIFKSNSMANRIVAANSGFYTLPDASVRFPFGTDGTPVSQKDIQKSFASKLVVLLGESDDKTEKRGTMLHTLSADAQGLGRFERGRYFFSQSQELAKLAKTPIDWQLKSVEGVGHDYRKMGVAAAELLYGNK
jgi:hypothetical protein